VLQGHVVLPRQCMHGFKLSIQLEVQRLWLWSVLSLPESCPWQLLPQQLSMRLAARR